MRRRYLKTWAVVLILSISLDQFAVCKRSGGYSRGSSSSRGSRGFSNLGKSSRQPAVSHHNYGGGGTSGRSHSRWTDRLFGRNRHNGGTSAGNRGRGILGGGGIFGRGHGSRANYGPTGGMGKKAGLLGGLGSRGLGGGGRSSMFRSSGVGSHSRANTFKNMVVGAAAGFLAYKAGKAIIKNVAAPMMWNNRPYYWGSQYYPHHHQPYGGAGSYGAGGYGGGVGANSRTMCRMPIDPNDPTLGQVYMENNTRPKEIVWSCEYHEDCCGYECCPRGSGYQRAEGMNSGGYQRAEGMNSGGYRQSEGMNSGGYRQSEGMNSGGYRQSEGVNSDERIYG